MIEGSRKSRGISIRHLMWAVVVIAFVLALIVAFEWYALPILILAAVGCIVGAVTVRRQRRSDEQDSLLWLLAIATEKHMPIAVGVEAFADQWGRRARQRAFSVSTLLNLGLSLPDALERVPGAVPQSAMVIVRVGNETGLLEEALRESSAHEGNKSPSLGLVLEKIAYVGVLIAVIQSISSFIIYFIVPKFEAIFKDFKVDLPYFTILVIKFGNFAVAYLTFPLVIIIFLTLLCLVREFILLMLRVARLIHFSQVGSLWLLIRLLFGRLLPKGDSTTILRALAIGVDGGRPIEEVFRILAAYYPVPALKQRLGVAAERVHRGGDWIEALRLAKLIRTPDCAVLSSAQRAGNLAWALRTVALSGERRSIYRLQAFSELLFPMAMLLVGAFVLVSAVAFFSPLITLIERLSH